MGSREVLTKRQQEIIIGTLLGDACLEKNGKNFRLKIDHTEKYKYYIFWLYREFLPFSLNPRLIIETDKRNGKVYKRWHVATKSLPIFNKYYELFYKGRVKIVPNNLSRLISPLSLAIWFMDDGYKRKDSKGFYLCTSSFTSEEQNIIVKAISDCFGIETRIHHQKQYQRIFIPSKQAEAFNEIVKPFVLSVFKYKLL